MKVLLTAAPAISRVGQMVPLATALKQTGHEICWATSRSLAPTLRRMSFDCAEIVPDLGSLQHHAAERWSSWPAWPPDRRALHLFAVLLPQMILSRLESLIVDWNADLVVFEEFEFAGPLAAAVCGRPSVCLGWPGPRRTAGNLAALAQAVEQLWSAQGLAEVGLRQRLAGTLRISTCPPSLDLKFDPTDAGEILMQPGSMTSDLLDEHGVVPTLGGAVHASLGTVGEYTSDPGVLDAIVTGVHLAGRCLVLSVGPRLDPERWHDPTAGVYAYRAVSHDSILRQASVTIFHGGVGTFWRALSHGCPLIVAPQGAASQARNARACARRGVGISLGVSRPSARSVADAVRLVTDNAHYRLAALSVAREISSMPSPEQVIPRLERLASGSSRRDGRAFPIVVE